MMWVLGFIFFFEIGDINTFSYAAPAILRQWHLSISEISVVVSGTFFGMFAGGSIGGWISDRAGRRKGLIYTTLWYSGFSLLNAFVSGRTSLLLTRLLTGVGLAAMTVVGITYVSEMFPTKSRGKYQGLILMIGFVGVPAMAYVARFLIPLAPWGWRLVFVWGSLGGVLAVFAKGLQESPRWLEKCGRTKEADEVLTRIEERVRVERGDLPLTQEPVMIRLRRRAYNDLFRPAHRRQTAVLIVAWVCQTLGMYGFMAWVPTLLVAHGFSLVNSLSWSSAMSIGSIPGPLLAAAIADRWERKWSIAAVALTMAGCGLLYGMTFRTIPIIVFGFLLAMFGPAFGSLLYTYTPEAYPTEIRNSGVGLTYAIGRLANVTGPLLVAFFYNHFGYMSVFVYIATCWVVVAITVSGFGMRTKARSLEQLSEATA